MSEPTTAEERQRWLTHHEHYADDDGDEDEVFQVLNVEFVRRLIADVDRLERERDEAVALVKRTDDLLTGQGWVEAEEDIEVLKRWQGERQALEADARAFLARLEERP